MKLLQREIVQENNLPSDLHPKIRQIYASRGLTDSSQLDLSNKSLQHFKGLKGLPQAIDRLYRALQQQQKIMIIGDFDADGATSVSLMLLALEQLGCRNKDFLVPNRFDFGYGLSPEIVAIAKEQEADLIITVDNGISCINGVNAANQCGIDVIVTDHHLPGEELPDACAIVNPNQPECDFLSKNLAGVGVAFYLMMALRSFLQQQNWFEENGIPNPNLTSLLDLVSLGTVADVVPLDNNNRILVHQGLQRIRAGQCRPGIAAILEVAGKSQAAIDASDLGFVVGPRLNAAGRLDDMALGIKCLVANDTATARRYAVTLDALNKERREIESSMQKDAESLLRIFELDSEALPNGIVLFESDWHQGIIGILAGRIKDKYFRPTIAFAHQDEQILKGSARSISGLHIRDLLEELNSRYPGIIDKFGGHAAAAGLSLKVENFQAFKTIFESLCEEWLASHNLEGEILTDGQLTEGEFTLDFARLVKRSGPWGQGFPEPIFDGEFTLLEQRIVGQKHLKLMLQHGSSTIVDGIMFNVDLQQWPCAAKRAKLAFKLDVNSFRNRESVQLLVQGLEPL